MQYLPKIKTNHLNNFILRLLIIMSISSCNPSQTNGQKVNSKAYGFMLDKLLKHNVPEIDVQQLTKSDSNFILLDCREKEEYRVSHFKNADWVGYKNFSLSSVNNIPHNKPIITYCSVGYRSEKIAEQLKKAGFTDVKNLYGGIFEWVNEGHPVYDRTGRTDSVHAYNHIWGIWLKKGKKVY